MKIPIQRIENGIQNIKELQCDLSIMANAAKSLHHEFVGALNELRTEIMNTSQPDISVFLEDNIPAVMEKEKLLKAIEDWQWNEAVRQIDGLYSVIAAQHRQLHAFRTFTTIILNMMDTFGNIDSIKTILNLAISDLRKKISPRQDNETTKNS